MIPKPEQTRWASQEAAIKAEINQARNTFDLVRMANGVVRLDALHAQIEAAGNSGLQPGYIGLAPGRFKDLWRD